MCKRLFILLTLICAGLPQLASASTAWQLTARVNNPGGSLTVRGGAPTSGTFFKIYTTSQNVPVVITATSGYNISSVAVNGGAISPVPGSPVTYQMGLTPYPGKTSQSVSVYFAKQLYPVTASAGVGGGVYPSGTTNVAFGAAATYTFSPNTGNQVVAISGVPSGATLTDTVTAAAATLPAPVNHPVKVSFTMPAAGVTMSGAYVGLIADAGAPQTVFTGQTVTLGGSATVIVGGAVSSWTWTQTGGPATVTLSDASAQTPTFSTATNGTYNFQLVASNGASSTASTYVVVSSSAAAAVRSQCLPCHISAGVGQSPNVFNLWSSSKHNNRTEANVCAGCHFGADTGAHPGADPLATCAISCHAPGQDRAVAAHTFPSDCRACHNVHSLVNVVGSVTPQHKTVALLGATVAPATAAVQYLNSPASCTDCHNPAESALQAAARLAWADSKHGLVTESGWGKKDSTTSHSSNSYDGTKIPAGGDCIRCHFVQGFIQFTNGTRSIAGLGNEATKISTPLNCNGCHTDNTFARRSVVITAALGAKFNGMSGVGASIFYNISSIDNVTKKTYRNRLNVTFPDVGESNLCVNCHGGRGAGNQIAAVVGTGTGLNGEMTLSNGKIPATTHNLPVAGVMYMKQGFINFTSLTASLPTVKSGFPSTLGTATTYAKTVTSNIDLAGGVSSTHRALGTKKVNGDGHNPSFFVSGVLDDGGPCVTCHMQGKGNNIFSGTDDRTGAGHSLDIDQDAFTQVCSNCHSSENGHVFGVNTTGQTAYQDFQQFFLDPQGESFTNARTLATSLLLKKYGIIYTNAAITVLDPSGNSVVINADQKIEDGTVISAPSSTTVYDGTKATASGIAWYKTAVTDAAWKTISVYDFKRNGTLSSAAATKLIGSIYNLSLFYQDQAAFAHARSYTRRLVYDTIDFLDDGVINFSVGATAIAQSLDPTSPVTGLFTAGASAYTADGALDANGVPKSLLDVVATGTSESMLFLVGWNRTYGTWNNFDGLHPALERP